MVATALKVSDADRGASEQMSRSSSVPHRQVHQARGLLLAAAMAVAGSMVGDAGSGGTAEAAIDPGRRLCLDGASGAAASFQGLTPGDLVVVNLIPVNASAPGDGQLVSSDTVVPPTASNVNFAPGTVDPNVAFAPVGADGSVCFYNSDNADVDLVADLQAVLAADTYAPNPPDGAQIRIADTRIGRAGGRIAPGERRCFASRTTPGDLAVVNLTPVLATAAGNGVLTSSDITEAPTASNVNFAPGTVDPNVAITPVGTDGRLCFHNSHHAELDLIADLQTTLHANIATPPWTGTTQRLADTRIGLAGARIAPGERRCFASGAIPGDLAVVNLTPVLATAAGNGVLTSSNITEAPTASNVNFAPGTVDPNVAVAPVGTDGQLCFHNSDHAELDLIADLQTTLDATAAAVTSGLPVRLVNTRPERRDTINCPTATRCYAAGDQFYVSDDFGATWQLSAYAASDLDQYPDDRNITCFSADVCDFSGIRSPGRLASRVRYVTVDGGQTWRRPAGLNVVADIACPSSGTCIAVGAYWPEPSTPSTLFRRAAVSTDGGRIWRDIELPPPAVISSVTWLTDVACESASKCSAIAISSALSTSTTLLTLTSDDGWSTVTVTER